MNFSVNRHRLRHQSAPVSERAGRAAASFGTGLLAALLAALPARAETERVLPDTVVSASRVPVDRRTVGSSISIITKTDIEVRRSAFASDLLRELPGLNVNRSGVYGQQTQVRIRGAEANHVLVRIDDMIVNDPAAGNEFLFENLLRFGLGRIEVLRGPQSGLYGPDAVAGVVSFYTADPEPGLRAETITELGSFGQILGGGRLSFGAKNINATFIGLRQRMNGTNAVRSSNPLYFNEQDRNANTTLHGKVKAYVTDWLELSFVGQYVRAYSEFDTDTNFDGLLDDADRFTRRRYVNVLAKAAFTFLEDRWRTELSIGYLDSDTRNFTDQMLDSTQNGKKLRLAGQTSYRFRTPGTLQAEHTVILAADHEQQKFGQTGMPFSFFGTVYDPNQERTRYQTGIAAEYRLAVLQRIFLNASVRHDFQANFADQTTWRFGAAYLLRRTGTRFHASVATGFKNPTFTEQYGFFPTTFVGNPDLKPETSLGWDIGVEQRFFGGRVVVDATFFQTWLEDEINGFASLPGGLTTAENFEGTSRRHGIELSLTARLFDRLSVKGSYTFLIAQQPPGTEEIRRPRHSGAINFTYTFLRKRATINAGLVFNAGSSDLNFGPFPAQTVRLGGYVLANISASFKISENLEIYGRVENAFNQRYEEVYSYKSPRIGVFGGFKLRFGVDS